MAKSGKEKGPNNSLYANFVESYLSLEKAVTLGQAWAEIAEAAGISLRTDRRRKLKDNFDSPLRDFRLAQQEIAQNNPCSREKKSFISMIELIEAGFRRSLGAFDNESFVEAFDRIINLASGPPQPTRAESPPLADHDPTETPDQE